MKGPLALAAAYLLGSIPWSFLLVRWLAGRDVRELGSGNVGATNVLRTTGKLPGIVALVLDAAKGAAAVLLAQAWGLAPAWVAACALAAVVGHVYPVFLGFRGGKGVATAAGALGTLSPPALLVSLAVFAAIVAVTRFVSLGSIGGVGIFPPALWLAGAAGWSAPPGPAVLGAAVGAAALVLAKHRSNVRRLRAGTERRLGEGGRERDP